MKVRCSLFAAAKIIIYSFSTKRFRKIVINKGCDELIITASYSKSN